MVEPISMTDRALQCDLGSMTEQRTQERFATASRAAAFRRHQVLDHLNPAMQAFIGRQEMAFIATSDREGHCDCSFRAGPPGFVRVLSVRTLAYPEYRGNGVLASLANIEANGHASLLFVDFEVGKIGLHVNGWAAVLSNEEMAARADRTPVIAADLTVAGGRRPERWVVLGVEEAYVHCSKHIPIMRTAGLEDRQWGTDDERAKGGDYFGVASSRRAARDEHG
jgi:uncharacterized protein